MKLAGRTVLVRVLLVSMIGLSLPLKAWLERQAKDVQMASYPPRAQTEAEGSAKSTQSLPLPNHSRSKEVYDLSRLGLSIPTPAQSIANHSPSLAALSSGELAMAWFGGSREGARDVRIFFSRFVGLRWTAAHPIMGTDQLIKESGRYVTKLGNPMLYFDGERLHCWFVSVSLGGWGGARLNHMVSMDKGVVWSTPKLLITSPFLNVSTLVRATALPVLDDSTGKSSMPGAALVSRETLLPAYFELTHKYPVMLRVDSNGRLLDRYPFGGLTGLLQPSVIRIANPLNPIDQKGPDNRLQSATEQQSASDQPGRTDPQGAKAQQNPNAPDPLYAYFRRSQALSEAKVFRSQSLDQGKTWSVAQATAIPNGDASVVAWADSNQIWLVANPGINNRRSIASFRQTLPQLAKDDQGEEEKGSPSLILDQVSEVLPGHQEFSYPSFAQTLDGRLHLVYTADGRKAIRHRIWSPIGAAPEIAAQPQAPVGKLP
jgi:predicted neuraminidase